MPSKGRPKKVIAGQLGVQKPGFFGKAGLLWFNLVHYSLQRCDFSIRFFDL